MLIRASTLVIFHLTLAGKRLRKCYEHYIRAKTVSEMRRADCCRKRVKCAEPCWRSFSKWLNLAIFSLKQQPVAKCCWFVAGLLPILLGSSLFSVEWQVALGGVILGFAKKAPPCGRGTTTPGRRKPKNSSKRIRGKMLHLCCTNVAPNVAP